MAVCEDRAEGHFGPSSLPSYFLPGGQPLGGVANLYTSATRIDTSGDSVYRVSACFVHCRGVIRLASCCVRSLPARWLRPAWPASCRHRSLSTISHVQRFRVRALIVAVESRGAGSIVWLRRILRRTLVRPSLPPCVRRALSFLPFGGSLQIIQFCG